MNIKASEYARFTSAGLSVRKQRAVVTHEDFLQHRMNDVMVDCRLVGFRAKDHIKRIGTRGG